MSFLACTNGNLNRLLPGYTVLSRVEKKRINEFSLVWQLFEGRVFGHNANSHRMLNLDWFGNSAQEIRANTSNDIAYFRDRFLLGEDAPDHLNSLIGDRGENLRPCIMQGLGEQAEPELVVRGCGAVCLRLRNNLFHGGKAAYDFEDQLRNFTHGVRFLNSCLNALVEAA